MSSNNSENNPDMINDTINITGTQTTDYLYALFTNPSLLNFLVKYSFLILYLSSRVSRRLLKLDQDSLQNWLKIRYLFSY